MNGVLLERARLRKLPSGTHRYPARVRLLIPVIALVLALAAAVSLDRPLPPADFVLIDRSDVYTLDPQRMSYQHELRRARVIYEPLVNLRASDCVIVPGVAERWEVSPDGRTYTFHLRADAKWSNGDPVTSEDFRYSWGRAILPDSAADYSGLFFAIKGAKPFFDARNAMVKEFAAQHAGRPSAADAEALWKRTAELFDSTVGLHAPDARTLVVTLDAPLAYFLDLCAFPCFSPVHPPTVEQFVSLDPATGRLIQRHDWTKPGRIVVNGAYVPVVWRYKRDMRLEQNPHYWNKAAVVAKSIECRTVENPNTGVLSFQSGAADWLTDLGPEYKTEMLAERRAYLERFRADLDAGLARGERVDDIVALLPPPGEGERRDVFERYIGEVSKSLHHIHGADTREVYDALLAQAKKRTRQADQVLNEDGKVVKAEDPSDQEGVLVVANAIPALAQSDRSEVKDSHLEAKKPFQNANVNAKTKRGKVSANESAKIKKSKRDDDSPTLFEAD